MLGINGERLIQRANGIDPRKVDPDSVHDFKSIGNSTTLRFDTADIDKIKSVLARLTERVEERLIRRKLKGKSVQLMIRYENRETVTRSKKLPEYIQRKEEILPVILHLLDTHWTKKPVRLLGVTVQDLLEAKHVVEQLDLFTYKERKKELQIEKTIEKLKEKYGSNPFVQLDDEEKIDDINEEKLYRTSFQKDFLDDYKEIDEK